VVAGGGAFDDAGAVAGPPGGQQRGQDRAADDAGPGGAGGIDSRGSGELVAGGFQGRGEAGPVWVGAGPGLDGVGHGHPHQLVKGQQRPGFLLQARLVAGAQHVAVQQGMPQRVVGTLDLPSLVVEPDQGERRVTAVVQERGDQPVPVSVRLPSEPVILTSASMIRTASPSRSER
jgi:hypothetical protein